MGWFRRNEHDHEQLSAYLDGELDPREAEILEGHLATCDACAAILEDLRGTRAMLSALPAQLPRRSFVLGAEYARTPAKDAPALSRVEGPARRLSFALAPALALSVFVALLVVDLAGNGSTSSDESAAALTAASSRQADDASAGAAASSAGSEGVPPAQESANSTFDADATSKSEPEAAEAPAATPDAAAAAGAAAQVERASGGDGTEATPAAGEAAIMAADAAPSEEPAPDPLTFEAPDGDDDDGISTVRVLQVLALAAFLASGFYVFVWPRVSRGGS